MRGGLCTREAKALTDHDTQRLKMNPEEYVGRMLEEYEEAKALNGFGQGLIGEGGRQLRADGRSSAGSGGRAPNSNGSGATSSTRPVEVPLEEADELDGNHNLKSMIPEPTANVHEASWTGPFSVINTTTSTAMRPFRLISRGWTNGIWQDVYLVQCQRDVGQVSTSCGHPRIREHRS